MRRSGDQQAAKRFKDARWVLLKNPANLTDRQAATQRDPRKAGGGVWRAYQLKEATRGIFAPGLGVEGIEDLEVLLDRLLSTISIGTHGMRTRSAPPVGRPEGLLEPFTSSRWPASASAWSRWEPL